MERFLILISALFFIQPCFSNCSKAFEATGASKPSNEVPLTSEQGTPNSISSSQKSQKTDEIEINILLGKLAKRDPGLQNTIGQIYRYGLFGISSDLTLAKQWFTEAAEKGHVPAQYNLGEISENDNQFDVARKWYNMATKGGHFGAYFKLEELRKKMQK